MTPGPSAVPQPQPNTPDLKALVRNKGHKLNLVDRNNLFTSIDQAVIEAVAEHVSGIDREQLKMITLSARHGIVARLKNSSKAIRGVPQSAFLQDVMKARRHLTKEREKLTGELDLMQNALQARRQQFAEKQEELVRETQEEGQVQDHALAQQIRDMFALVVEQNPELAAIQDQVTSLALMGVNQERQKLLDSRVEEHQDRVDQFERRIAKLSNSLNVTEAELKRIAAMKGVEGGVASIYRTVQGLSDGEDNAEAKLEMLQDLFEANLELKNQLTTSR